ncbi:MAG: SH3 domain-containing protein [Caldilineaceae bacterium]
MAEPLPQPAAADIIETAVQYVQALVNVNMRSGPGTDYGIVGSIFAGQTARVTGVMPDGGWWRAICPDDSVGSCFVVNDPSLTQPASAPDAAAPSNDDAAMGTVVYEDTTAGLCLRLPGHVDGERRRKRQPRRHHSTGELDGTQLDVSVLAWDPQNDLDAYVATRKIAWEASGITILQADEWTLSSGQPSLRFIVRGSDGASTGFFSVCGAGWALSYA